jgi:uncharacterized protein YlzI (FlbEa/FlbD family)
MILVTQKDGTSVALNVDRLERIERNAISHGRGSNVFFVGGGHLVVEESQEALLELILEAKARVQARATALAASTDVTRDQAPTPLRVLPQPDGMA